MAIGRTSANLSNQYFTPDVYSARLQAKWYEDSVIPMVCNTNWENEIKAQGQTVYIRKRPNVTMQAYVVNQAVNWQDVADERISFTVDYAFSAAVKVDRVDEAQNDINVMSELEIEISKKAIEKEVETVFGGTLYSSASSSLSTSTALSQLQSGAAQYVNNQIGALATKLNVLKVPQSERWLLVHPAVEEIIIGAEAGRFDSSGAPNQPMEVGQLGATLVRGFRVFRSTFIPGTGAGSGSPYRCLAGHKEAVSFARQIMDFKKNIDLIDYHATGAKALDVFGFKATQPDGLVAWNARLS